MTAFLGILGKAFVSFFLKLVMSLATESFIEWLFFYVGELIVKSTKTQHDDIFLAKIKEIYETNASSKNTAG
mgnify:CR=1 FL=1